MNNLKKSFCLSVLLLFFKIGGAQDWPLDTTGIYMSLDNEITYMFGTPTITASTLTYHDQKSKEYTIAMKKMKWMLVGNRVFCALPIRRNSMYRLMEVLAMTKEHILMSYWQNASYLYVFDYESNVVKGKIMIFEGGKRNNRKALEEISPYFDSCKELMEQFESNIKNNEFLIKYIYAYQCKGAPDIMKFLATFKDKRIDDKD